MIFVRRFIRLKQKMCANESDRCFSAWVTNLLKQAAEDADSSYSSTTSGDASGESSDDGVFNDSIEPGELGRITGREPEQPVVSLTKLKKDHAAKSWLFNKYYNMCFVDKNS